MEPLIIWQIYLMFSYYPGAPTCLLSSLQLSGAWGLTCPNGLLRGSYWQLCFWHKTQGIKWLVNHCVVQFLYFYGQSRVLSSGITYLPTSVLWTMLHWDPEVRANAREGWFFYPFLFYLYLESKINAFHTIRIYSS